MTTTFASDAAMHSLLTALIDRTLPKSDWTHEAHFAAAIVLLSDSRFQPVRDMPPIIRAYNEATGVANTDIEGYHHTITLASLRATRFIMAQGYESLTAALTALMRSEFARSDWLLRYWSREHLFTPQARKSWVEPDISPLPF